MRGSAWLLACLMAAVAFAGCTDDTADPADSLATPSGATTPPPTGSSTPDGGAAEDTVTPRIEIAPSIALGPAPLTVTFNLTGEDPNGDDVSWTLDVDGDGDAEIDGDNLPSAFDYTYTAIGQYSARFAATDGSHPATAIVNITVTPGDPDDVPPPITIQGTATGFYIPGAEYQGEPTLHTFDLLVVVNNFTAVMDWPQQTIDLDWWVRTPTGQYAGSQANYNLPVDNPVYHRTPDPIVVDDPALLAQLGAWQIEVYGGLAVDSAYTITITFH